MKSKTWLIIGIVVIVVILLIARRRSQKGLFINYPTTAPAYNQIITPAITIPQNQGTANQGAASIDADIQSIDNLIGGINTSDFSPNTLDGIE